MFDPSILPWSLIMLTVHKTIEIASELFVLSNELHDKLLFAFQASFNKAPNWYLKVQRK